MKHEYTVMTTHTRRGWVAKVRLRKQWMDGSRMRDMSFVVYESAPIKKCLVHPPKAGEPRPKLGDRLRVTEPKQRAQKLASNVVKALRATGR